MVIGPCTYWLDSRGNLIRCGIDTASSGQAPVRQEMQFASWATRLFDEIARENLLNHESLVALRHLVE